VITADGTERLSKKQLILLRILNRELTQAIITNPAKRVLFVVRPLPFDFGTLRDWIPLGNGQVI
jgi:hypothetical protein